MIQHWIDWLPNLLRALWMSVKYCAGALVLGLPLGVVLAIGASTGGRALRWVILIVVELGRGIPALVLLYFVYFGLPDMHLTLSSGLSIVLALGLNCAAYASEIFRGGIEAIPRGQHDAARAVGLTSRWMWLSVLLPQMLRNVTPPVVGLSILVFQTTSLAMTIGANELMGSAYTIGSVTFEYMSVIVLAAVLYALVAIPASRMVSVLERRNARTLAR